MGAMTGQQIYENFLNAPGTDGLEAAQRQLAEVRVEYGHLQAEITKAAAALEEHWQGEASGAAQRGAGPLAVAHGQAGGEMEFADNLLRTQVDSFHVTKNSVRPVPPVPPMPASFNEMVEGGAKNYFQATTAANNAAQSNVAVMDGWTRISGDNGARMPVTYGTIDPGAFSVSQGTPGEKPGAIDGFRGAPEQRKRSGAYGPPRTPAQGPRPGESTVDPSKQTPPPQAPPPQTPPQQDPPKQHPPQQGPPQKVPPNHRTPVADDGDQTTRPVEDHPGPNPVRQPVTDVPRTPVSGPPGGGGPNWVPPGLPGPEGRTNGPGAGRTGVPGPGTGGTAGRLGGGPGSGAGPAGTRGMAEPGMRGGTAGKPGANGMTPGAGGQRGKGAEDEEHHRKYILDDDSHFLPGEEGEKVVDPTTGMAPTPPVIGK
ncbi:hypothetical protein [Amycolatopsis sp. NPDC051071]|uniref:hypothetical protein n=1 Tax=Amycolatopsis sp. NPDC051071 TaxID=3154637 RepID=UPI003445343F